MARNPNTPPEHFAELSREFPDDVLQNPALELLILEQPSFLSDMSAEARIALSSSERADEELLSLLGGGAGIEAEVRAAVAANPNTPLDLVRKLAGQAIAVRAGAAQNPDIPDELLHKLAADKKAPVRAGAARNLRLPSRRLEELADDEDVEVREAVAANPNTPPRALARLATSWAPSVRLAALANESTPEELVSLMKRANGDAETSEVDRVYLAAEISVDEATRLADPNLLVFGWYLAAQHPQLPSEILRRLADHDWAPLLRRVARNPSTPADVLAGLAEDGEFRLQSLVARNPSTPRRTLKRLLKSSSKLEKHVAHHPSEPPMQLSDRNPSTTSYSSTI